MQEEIKSIIKEYMTNKKANEILRINKKQECRSFHEIDEWNGNKVFVYNKISASAIELWE